MLSKVHKLRTNTFGISSRSRSIKACCRWMKADATLRTNFLHVHFKKATGIFSHPAKDVDRQLLQDYRHYENV